jgi:hypothetical protein
MVVAKSKLLEVNSDIDNDISNLPDIQLNTATEEKGSDNNESKENSSGWQHSEWEVGRRVVSESSTGEEVALRRVLLDSTDGGPAENILLEEGVRFTNAALNRLGSSTKGESVDGEEEESSRGGILHPIDQAVILSQCLDVKNSNPAVCI